MSFRDDVRLHFERKAELNPVPVGLREAVRAEAARSLQSDRPHTLRWAVAVAGVLAVAVIAGLLASGGLRRVVTTPVAPARSPSRLVRPVGVLPPGNLVDASLYDVVSGWVLLDRCSNGSCTYFVSTSHSGGPWTGPVQVGPAYPAAALSAPRHVQVVSADGMSGFVYGEGEVFVTHDGGLTWQQLSTNRGVVSITGLGTAWMVTLSTFCAYNEPCAQVQISRDGGRTWTQTSQLPVFSPANVVAFEKGGLLMSAYGTGDMLLTQDGGLTWSPIRGNCRSDSESNRVTTADGSQIWQTCTGAQPNAVDSTMPWSSELFVSSDGGKSWAAQGLVRAGTFQTLWSPAHDSLVVATNSAGVMVTRDGGHNWTQIITNPQHFAVLSLSYLADGSAWAVGYLETVWGTADAGQTWVRLAAGSPTGG